MADITPYAPGPGSVANQVVGTPGVNNAAGQDYATLANAAGQLNQAYTNDAHQSAAGLFNVLSGVAYGVGAAISRHVHAQNAMQQMLNHSKVVAKAYEFQQAAAHSMRGFRQQYADDPQNAVPAYKEYLTSNAVVNGKSSFVNEKGEDLHIEAIMDWAKNDAQIRKDPAALKALSEKLHEMSSSLYGQLDNWSFNQEKSNTEAFTKKVSDDVVTGLSQQTGDMDSRLAHFTQTINNADMAVEGLRGTMGSAYTDNAKHEMKSAAAATYFGTGVANRPEDPEQALAHLTQLKGHLAGSHALGMTLTDKQRQTVMGQIHTAEEEEVNDLKNRMVSSELEDNIGISQKRFMLAKQRGNVPLQNQAIDWAADQTVVVQKRIGEVTNDVTLPDKAKNVVLGRLNSQLGHLHSLVSEAHSNLQFNKSEARQAQSDARREAAEGRRQAHQDLMEARNQSQAAINGMRLELQDLLTDPINNKSRIIETGAKISNATIDAGHKGLLTPDQAFSAAKEASRLVKEAAQYKEKPGFWIFPDTITRISPDSTKASKVTELTKRENEYLDAMKKAQEVLKQSSKIEAVNQKYVDFTPSQNLEFSTRWAGIKTKLSEAGATAAQISVAETKLRNSMLTSGK